MLLNFKEYGDGPSTVIIVHGLFGMLDNWQSFARQLSEHYKVYTVDMRNHGRSPHREDMSYELMSQDLLEFMVGHEIDSAHLVGHSMGGKVVMQTALSSPDRVASLTVVDIAPKAYPPGHLAIMDAMANVDLHVERRAEVEQDLATRVGSLRIARFLMKNLTRSDDIGFEWKLNLPAIQASYEAIIGACTATGEYPGPVLFMNGAESDYVTEEDHALILGLFPAARFISITGAGHWLHADQPERTLQALLFFLRDYDDDIQLQS